MMRTAVLGTLLRCVPASLFVAGGVFVAGALEAQDPPAQYPPGTTTATEAERALWVAVALERVLDDSDFATPLLLSALNRAASGESLDGQAELDAVLTALAGTRSAQGVAARALSACRAEQSSPNRALCAVERLTPLLPGGVARNLTEEGARLVGLYARSEPGGDPLRQYAIGALEAALGLSTSAAPLDPGAGSVADGSSLQSALWTAILGVDPSEGRESLLSVAPSIQRLLEAHPSLRPLASGSRAPGAVLADYRSFLAEMTSITSELAAAGDDLQSIEASARAGLGGGERALVYLASRSASLAGADQPTVERILTLGNAALDLRESGSGFSASLAALGRDAALAALNGNVLATLSTVTSFFGLTPGAFGPGAAEEIRLLRDGIDSLDRQVNAGFENVDARFDSLFVTLDDRFGRLEQLVATGDRRRQEEIAALHDEVVALGEQIERTEDVLRTYMSAGFDRDYSRTLVRCLEHRSRYLPPYDQMDFGTFSGCLSDFRVRAVVDARDALLTDQSTAVDDISLAAALTDPSPENLSRRLPLLGRAAEQRFGFTGLRGGRGLANPVEWAVAAHAYLTLLHGWPDLARSVAPDDLEEIHAVGVSLRDALASVTEGGGETPGGTLLGQVLGYYSDRVAELTGEAAALARRHRQAGLLRVPPETVMRQIDPVEGTGQRLIPPSTLSDRIPREVRTAAVLGLGDASLVYRLATEDSVRLANFHRRWLIFGQRHDRLTYTRVSLLAEVRFGDLGTLTTHRLDGPWVLHRREEISGDERTGEPVGQPEILVDPIASFLTRTWPEVSRDPAAWVHTRPHPSATALLEARIEGELSRYATAAVDGVFRQACSGGVARAGADPADEGSVARIRQALDGLAAAQALLQGYLGLSVEGREVHDVNVWAALQGPDGLLDRAAFCATISAGDSPLRTVWLEEEPGRRLNRLTEALAQSLDGRAIMPAAVDGVGSIVDQLETAMRLQRARTLVARVGP